MPLNKEDEEWMPPKERVDEEGLSFQSMKYPDEDKGIFNADEEEEKEGGEDEGDGYSWCQPEADFPVKASNSEEVTSFLHGNEEWKIIDGFKGKQHAENWSKKYFNGGESQGSGYSVKTAVEYLSFRDIDGKTTWKWTVILTKTIGVDDEDQMGKLHMKLCTYLTVSCSQVH